MIDERRTTVLALACGIVLAVAWGCAGSSPEVGDAESALEEGNHEAALANANQAIERDSANANAYLFKADVLRRMADSTMEPSQYADLYGQAIAAEEEALAIDSTLREKVQSERRRIYDRESRRGERAYNRASKYDRQDVFRYAAGFFGAAGATQPDSARPVLNEAYARLRMGQRKAVVPVLERYFERTDTARKDAHKILGKLYVSGGQYEKATKLLDRAVEVYPKDRDLQALRLNAYNRAGDVDEALVVYREQIEAAPNRAAYRYNYGALLLKAKRYTEAIDQLSKAVELQPDNPEGQYNLGAAYLNAALVRDDSIATIEQNPDAVPDSTVAVNLQIGRLAEKREELFEKAIPPLERARALTKEQHLQLKGKKAIRRDACRALLVAYVQTQRPGRAAQVEDCTELAGAR